MYCQKSFVFYLVWKKSTSGELVPLMRRHEGWPCFKHKVCASLVRVQLAGSEAE